MFTDAERSILRFNNGKRPDAAADPELIHTKLLRAAMDDGKDIDVIFKQIRGGEDRPDDTPPYKATLPQIILGKESLQTLIGYVHKAFGTSPMDEDGNGLTSEEAIANLNALMSLNDAAKKNGDETPPESPATDGPPADSEPTDLAESASPSLTPIGTASN